MMKTVGLKKCIIPAVFVFLQLLAGCSQPAQPQQQTEPAAVTQTQTAPPRAETLEEKAHRLCLGMTAEEKVGQMFLVHWPGADGAELAAQYHLGGYIFFADYFETRTPEQVREEMDALQAAQKMGMLTAVDEEGGGVTRISQYPQYRSQPFAAPWQLYNNGGLERVAEDTKEKCELLGSLGINVNLAPVCDISQNPSDYIYYRTLGRGAKETADYVACVVEAMQGSGVGCTLKHFPGYGGNADTHTGIAVDGRSYQTFAEKDFLPFSAGIDAGAESVMVSHNIITAVDESCPASLSSKMHSLLRQELGFEGVIITDDLTMEGIRAFCGEEQAAVAAVRAGNDLLCCSDFETQIPAVLEALEQGEIDRETVDSAVERILLWKMKLGLIQ